MLNKKDVGVNDRLLSFVASDIFRRLTYFWFVIQATFMAVSTNLGISPDERYHYSFVQIFSINGWFPFIHNLYGNFQDGDVAHSPFFLYHYLLSLPYHLFAGSGHALTYLRIINILIVLTSFFFVVRIAKKLKISMLATNLGIFMIANTLMFVFLAGMVNYDSLFILLAVIAIDLMLSLFEEFKAAEFLGLLAILIAGVLTVINFLPIAVGIIIALIVKYWRDIGSAKMAFVSTWRRRRKVSILLSGVILILTGLFIQKDVLNLVNYHALSPPCQKTLSLSECQHSAIFARDQILANNPPAGRAKSAVGYLSTWLSYMKSRTFGIFGSKVIGSTKLVDRWMQLYIFLAIIAGVSTYRLRDRKISLILGISFIYLVILYIDNYSGYHRLLVPGAAVQGRYFFALLPIIFIIANKCILQLLRRSSLQLLFALLVIIFFITAGLPSYILKTTPDWHTPSTVSINQHLHDDLVKFYPKH